MSEKKSDSLISRRDLVIGAGAMLALGQVGNVFAAKPGHDHSKHKARHPGILNAVNDCVAKGQQCIAHCLVAFGEGDTSLAKCAAKVHEMQAVCDAFSYLLAANSSYVKSYAKICERVCKDCEKECLKHKEHIECKACADACSEVVDQIKLKIG